MCNLAENVLITKHLYSASIGNVQLPYSAAVLVALMHHSGSISPNKAVESISSKKNLDTGLLSSLALTAEGSQLFLCAYCYSCFLLETGP